MAGLAEGILRGFMSSSAKAAWTGERVASEKVRMSAVPFPLPGRAQTKKRPRASRGGASQKKECGAADGVDGKDC
jgi:hypothetical protein